MVCRDVKVLNQKLEILGNERDELNARCSDLQARCHQLTDQKVNFLFLECCFLWTTSFHSSASTNCTDIKSETSPGGHSSSAERKNGDC